MKKKHSIILILAAIVMASFKVLPPEEITWKTLEDVTYNKKWISSEKMFTLIPEFGASLKALEGKEVQITGYMIPVNIETGYYVLSANPYASCFFCGAAGPESVMSIKFKGSVKRFDTDDRVTLKGKLALNQFDMEEMNYILKETTVVE